MRAMKYSKGYQITFSLMNGDPESVHVDWDIRDAIQSNTFTFTTHHSKLLTKSFVRQATYHRC